MTPSKYLVLQRKLIANAPQSASKHRKMPQNAATCRKTLQNATKRSNRTRGHRQFAAKHRKTLQNAAKRRKTPLNAAKCRKMPQNAAKCRKYRELAISLRETKYLGELQTPAPFSGCAVNLPSILGWLTEVKRTVGMYWELRWQESQRETQLHNFCPTILRGRLILDYLAGGKKSQNKNFDDHITTI